MTKVKDFQGISIYVTKDGRFYCDVINNSNDFNKKTFDSEKIQSIEKAIKSFEGSEIKDGKQYYSISPYHGTPIQLLTIVKRVGDRLFFDDGTDVSRRGKLYPKEIDTTEHFKQLQSTLTELDEVRGEITKLYEKQRMLTIKSSDVLKKL
jgi:hypothetical protein